MIGNYNQPFAHHSRIATHRPAAINPAVAYKSPSANLADFPRIRRPTSLELCQIVKEQRAARGFRADGRHTFAPADNSVVQFKCIF
jgi:hypothetical protein